MENNLLNETEIGKIGKTITLAYFGATKGGKTTGIATLTAIPDQIIELASGDDGRTRTTVQYHINSDNISEDIAIERIELSKQNIIDSDRGDVAGYNARVKKNKVFKDVLGLSELNEGEDVETYVLDKIEEFENKVVPLKELKQLMCTESIDKYIRRLTIKVPAQKDIAEYLRNNKIDLFIRDTRGLLDIALNDNKVEEQSSKSLRELGLENLDGIVFFCSDSYPNIIQDLYKDTFENVFKSVPVFLVDRVDTMFEIFKMNGQPVNINNISSLITQIQDGTHPIHSNIESKFYPTFKLMKYFDITEIDKQAHELSFKDTYFNQQKVEFILPNCPSLTDLSIFQNINTQTIVAKEDFLFYQMVSVVSCLRMIDMICNLQDNMQKLIQKSIATKYLWDICNSSMDILEKDFKGYDCYRGNTNYVRPQLDAVSRDRILQDIEDSNIELLGNRNGITTIDKSTGRLRYPTTAVSAVTARIWISKLISDIDLKEDLKESESNKLLFPDLKGNVAAQSILLRKALYSILYKKFTDTDASIRYYLIVDRHKAVKGINTRRNKQNTAYSAFAEVVQNVVYEFCECVKEKNLDDISNVIKNI